MKFPTVSLALFSLVIFVPCKAGNDGRVRNGSVSSGLGDGTASSSYYLASISPSKEVEGKCQRTVSVAGNGIKDEITVDCSTKRYVITNDDQLVVGETIYSAKPINQEPSTLVIVKGSICEQRTYENGVYRNSSTLNNQECDNVKQAMKKETDEWRKGGGSEDHNDKSNDNNNNNRDGNGGWDQGGSGGWGHTDGNSSVSSGLGNGKASSGYYLASISAPQEINNKCQKTVNVAGNGIKDVIIVDCSTKNYVITNRNQLVIGETIYSAKSRNQESNTLVIIKDGVCEQRTYNNGVFNSSALLNTQECDKIKEAMKKETERSHMGAYNNNQNSGNNYDAGDNNRNGNNIGNGNNQGDGDGGWHQGGSGSWGQSGNSGSWGQSGNSGSWGQSGNSGSWGQSGNSGSWGQSGNSGSWGHSSYGNVGNNVETNVEHAIKELTKAWEKMAEVFAKVVSFLQSYRRN